MLAYLIIFFISSSCILLELFFTRILNFKTWNHVVYTIIPFAILGYGIGTNIFLIFKNRFPKQINPRIIAYTLIILSLSTITSTLLLIELPIQIDQLMNLFKDIFSTLKLLGAYAIVMLPFISIGFLITYFFSLQPEKNNKFYFFDLVGAGLGAILFFLLINHLEIFRSIVLLSLSSCFLGLLLIVNPRQRIPLTILGLIIIPLLISRIPEIKTYTIDRKKGWEYIPGYFQAGKDYELTFSKWHPLGRTDIYRIQSLDTMDVIYNLTPVTFDINLSPYPVFSYFTTNYLAGTPVYRLKEEELKKYNIQVKLFSQAIEAPYTIFKNPKVVVVGTGGGRDIFMAKTHGAQSITGAEINPAIFQQMSKGGQLYEYSGQIYDGPNTQIFNIDGRHLVKILPHNNFDLIILNGVDTFSGLSTGAYAYAESYLYTKNAIIDYLKILKDNGVINFNRWLYADLPRESLKLFAISLAALREMGVPEPWRHIIIGGYSGWSILLIKKSPFLQEEKETIKKYFSSHETSLIFPTENWESRQGPITFFDAYAEVFQKKAEKAFEELYPYDISVITDNNPFFYKYYKFNIFNPVSFEALHQTGTVIFLTQLVVLLQAIIFIGIFISLPLWLFKKSDIQELPSPSLKPFLLFFSCLGFGFMLIEISLMQRFTLLLGSPIHSISITLASLLIFSGVGSGLLSFWEKKLSPEKLLIISSLILTLLIFLMVHLGASIFDYFMKFSFIQRTLIVCLALLPFGICLGTYFPLGLKIIGRRSDGAIAWAWGINAGFSVLGSMLAIVIGQFQGFNEVLLLALFVYLIACLAFNRLFKTLS